MDAIVLVGGEGTRMRPLTYDTPKQMLPIVDRPLIEHVALWLGRHGVDRLILSLGYRPDAFLAAYPDHLLAGLQLVCAVEPELLDTAGAVRFAAETAGVSERFFVLNGDVLTDFDLSSLLSFHLEHEAEASIFLTPVADPSAFGVVSTDREGRVLAFVEKPPPGAAPSNFINAGAYMIEPSVLDKIEKGRRVSIERETFPALSEEGALYALGSDVYWLDTGTPEKYIQAQLDILRGLRGAESLPPAAEASPGVFVSAGALPSGRLEAPVYLGVQAWVARDAEVRGSLLGDDVMVTEGALVAGSVVMAGTIIGKGAVVEDSIVGPGATIGEGSRVEALSVIRGGSDVPAGLLVEAARYGGPSESPVETPPGAPPE